MALKTSTIAILALISSANTAHSTAQPSTKTCTEPPHKTIGMPDYDTYCQCGNYTATNSWGSAYGGHAHCDTKCAPKDAAQREQHNYKAWSMDACVLACEENLSLEKRGHGWRCRGVNFVRGEVCEFVGQLGTMMLEPGSGNHCVVLS